MIKLPAALINFQEAPPSSDRYNPDPGFASINAYTRFGFAADIATLLRPKISFGSPPASLFQVSPPSTLL